MNDIVEAARGARDKLAGALGALLHSSTTTVMPKVATAIARATGHLYEIEASKGAALPVAGPGARDAVRDALADLQGAGIDNAAVDTAMAAVAAALGVVHELASRAAAVATTAPQPTTPQAAAPRPTSQRPPAPRPSDRPPAAQPVAAQPVAARPSVKPAANVATVISAPSPVSPAHAPAALDKTAMPVSAAAVTEPAPGRLDPMMATQLAGSAAPAALQPSAPSPVSALDRTAIGNSEPPPPNDAFYSTQVSRTGRSLAAQPPAVETTPAKAAPSAAPRPSDRPAAAHQPAAAQPAAAQPAAAQPAAGKQPTAPQPAAAAQPAAAVAPAPAGTQASPRVTEQLSTGSADRQGRKDSRRAPPPSNAPSPDAVRLEASLGAHSPTNFYKGLSGNDVVDDGGLFIATYQIPAIGAPVWITVSLPGGYEFEAGGVVRWTRKSGAGDAPPGFGASLKDISKEARQLIYRYVRNREPLFHDDL